MRVLVDEDLASRELLTRLEALIPGRVVGPNLGDSDDEVWTRAQELDAAILTGNVVDFLRLAEDRPTHAGLLLVYRTNDRRTNLKAGDIARRIASIAAEHPNGLQSQIVVVNGIAIG